MGALGNIGAAPAIGPIIVPVRVVAPAQRLLPHGRVMRKRHLAVGLVMVVASAVSYQSYELVHVTESSPAVTAEVGDAPPSSMGIHAAVVPRVMPAPAPKESKMLESIPDAVLLGATGAALFVIAAGVRRRAG